MAKQSNNPQGQIKRPVSAAPGTVAAVPVAANPINLITSSLEGARPWPSWGWAVLTLATALGYFLYSQKSDGFYQQDEAGHFIGMLDFWNDPKSILGNWAKWGYKLIYVVPAKVGGLSGVLWLNCILAACTAWLVAAALQAQGSRFALAGWAMLALQPLWVSLSFRNYSEVPTAFLIALAYYCHVRRQPLLSMLAVSYICTIRQEFYPILAVYGLNLLYRRQIVPALAGAVFPLLQNLYGYAYMGDPLYLVHQITGQAGAISDAYPRQGFDHYFKLSMVIFSGFVVALFVHYLAWGVLRRRKVDAYVVVPALMFFLMQCLFNAESLQIGPSTGGNLRYMMIIAPLLAIAAALGLEQFAGEDQKMKALYYLVPLLVITAVFLAYKSNLLQLTEEADGTPVIGVMLAGLLLFLTVAPQTKNGVVVASMGLLALFVVRPIKRSEEDQACKQLADWYKINETTFKGKPLFVNHVMFYYFLERTRRDFSPEPQLLTSQETVEKAPAGAAIFWDSHYSYRPKINPKAVTLEYFTGHPELYQMTNQIVTPSQNFGVFVFQKAK